MSEATTYDSTAIDLAGGWVPGTSFGGRLAAIRQKMGWNNSEAAKACGLDRQSWQNWEDGRKPRDEAAVAAKIAAATGCNLVWLLTGQVPAGAEVRTGSFATPLTLVDGSATEQDRTPRTGRLAVVR